MTMASDRYSILYLDNTYTFGGAINSLACLLRALDRDRFTPILVTGQPHIFVKQHFPRTSFYCASLRLPWVHNHIYRKLADWPVFDYPPMRRLLSCGRFVWWLLLVHLPEAWRYYRLGRRHRVGLVHLNNILGSQLAGILAAKLLRVPCVAHLRDFEEIHPVTRFYARLIDHHIAISSAIRQNLLDLGVPAEKISIVHDAIDPTVFASGESKDFHGEFGLAAGTPIFGIFGRIVPWKGIIEFVQAARVVCDGVPNAVAFIVGHVSDGDQHYLRKVRQLVKELGLEDRVIFTGYRSDVPYLMNCMDVVVHASVRPEPFGMVIIEGMLMGKPVVATKAGGPLDIVLDGETGFLVEPADPPALAEKIMLLLSRPDLRESMGSKGRARIVEHFSSARHAGQIAAVYERLGKRGSSQPGLCHGTTGVQE
jgi:glycosyltransferase involved in cell wall biosynthesis